MPNVIYRKAPAFPVYYKLDLEGNRIESLKDWQDRPKAIDLYIYYEDFAENIIELYEPVSAAVYEGIRNYIELTTIKPQKAPKEMLSPKEGLSSGAPRSTEKKN